MNKIYKNRYFLRGFSLGGQYVGLGLLNEVEIIRQDKSPEVIATIKIDESKLIINKKEFLKH